MTNNSFLFRSSLQTTLLFIVLVLCGCENKQDTVSIDNNSILATFEGGQVSVSDLENHLVNLPVNQRWSLENQSKTLEDAIKKVAIQKMLVDEAKLTGTEQSFEFIQANRDIERDLYTSQYLQNQNTQKQLADDALEAYYQENIETFNLAETRHVLHIFKSLSDTSFKEASELRQRAINGESFKLLAKEHSDSEGRHQHGSLGMVKRGDYSKDFDSVIFNLDKNSPSEVIKTADGHHVFWVADILKAKKYEFEDVKAYIATNVLNQLLQDTIIELANELEQPKPYFTMPNEGVLAAIQSGRINQNILTIGDFKYSASELLKDLSEITKPTSGNVLEHINDFLKVLTAKETIYQHMLGKGTKLQNTETLNYFKDLNLIELFSEKKMVNLINQNPEWINNFFDTNSKRYSTPVKIQVERLVIPNQKNTKQLHALEKQVNELDSGSITLQEVAEENNGKIQNLPLTTVPQLQKSNPRMVRFALLLKEGEHTPPYSNNQWIYIDKLIKKTKPQTQPLALVREKVVADYIQNHKPRLFRMISKKLLSNLQINQDTLNSYIQQKKT